MEITGSVSNITGVDILAIVLYFVIVIGFGIWSSLKNRGSVGGYFLAGRSMHFILVGASLFSSNIGSGHFIGLAGSGASTGIALAAFEFNAMLVLILLGWIFLPVYISSGVYTMPEYICKRFGGQRIRIYLAVLALLLSIFTKIAADLYAGALFINQAVGWNIYLAILLLLFIAALFTITGGLTAVMWTDFIQTIIMIVGAVYLMIVSFMKVGGYDQMKTLFLEAAELINFTDPATGNSSLVKPTNSDCAFPPENSFHLFRPATDDVLPWPGYIGITISSVWYWCSDQVIVQRALASKNFSHAKAGCLMAGYLKFLPLWLIVMPGMISRILFPEIVACSDPERCQALCGSPSGCTNLAYPILVLRLMPLGARGLMLAVMMSALMSSLSSVFNSSSTIFTMDIWVKIRRRRPTDTELMIVGRVFVLILVGCSIAWIPIVQNFAELFNYIQSVTSYLAPPICAVYVLAILWGRINEHGAFWGLMVGLLVGMTRFIWENVYTKVPCGSSEPDPRHVLIRSVHYLHFGVILFSITALVVVVVSLATKPIDEIYLARLLFWNRHSTEDRVDLNEEQENRKRARKEAEVNENPHSEVTAASSETTVVMQIEDPPVEKSSWWRKAGRWICGIEKEIHLSDEEREAMEKEHTSLDEDKAFYWVCNVGAILLAIFAVVVLVYFR